MAAEGFPQLVPLRFGSPVDSRLGGADGHRRLERAFLHLSWDWCEAPKPCPQQLDALIHVDANTQEGRHPLSRRMRFDSRVSGGIPVGIPRLSPREAIERSRLEDGGYACRHVCIEPYEAPVLEDMGIEVIRQKVKKTSRWPSSRNYRKTTSCSLIRHT